MQVKEEILLWTVISSLAVESRFFLLWSLREKKKWK
jgi:hypothetical protein